MLTKNPLSDLGTVSPSSGDKLIMLQKQADGSFKNVLVDAISLFGNIKGQIIGTLKGANLNTTNDQIILLSGGTKYIITDILITNASVAPQNAGGVNFTTGPIQTGDYIAYGGINQYGIKSPLKALTNPNYALMAVRKQNDFDDATIDTGITMFLTNPVVQDKIYFALSVAEGTPLTADVYLIGFPIA